MIKVRQNETIEVIERKNGRPPRRRVKIDCSRGGKTDQSKRDRCNINTIMKKALMTGMIENKQVIGSQMYGDFSTAIDFQQCQIKIAQAKEQFMRLPSDIRNRFQNDPSKLINFLNDPQNKEESIRLGLRNKPAPQPPQPEPATQPPEPPQPEQAIQLDV